MLLHRSTFFIFASFSTLLACGSDGLSAADVTNVPAGDATGAAATGTYLMSSITTGCSGTCHTIVDGVSVSVCDIGDMVPMAADATQADGVMQFDVTNSDYVSQLKGGIDTDGHFEVGGVRTQQGGTIEIDTLASGTIVDFEVSATATLHVTSIAADGLDCEVTTSLTSTD